MLLRRFRFRCALTLAALATPAPALAQTIVSLSFDDTTAEQRDAAEALEAVGLRGTFYVNSTRLDRPGYLTTAQVLALSAVGHEVGGHSLGHRRLTELDSEQARQEICADRLALLALGLEPVTFAYPFGDEDVRIHQMAEACGYAGARDVGGLRVGRSCPRCPSGESLPAVNPMAVRTPGSVRGDTSVADLQRLVLAAEEQTRTEGAALLPLVFHRICDGCSAYSMRAQDLQAFLTWLAGRSSQGTWVLPLSEALNATMDAPVTNLIANPSLEWDDDGDGIPDCWRRTQFGEHTALWTTTSAQEAHHGSIAQQVTVTAYQSGSSRLLSTCLPPVAEGQRLSIRAFYMTDAPVLWTAYSVDEEGRFKWWAQSPWLPPASSWRETEWSLPPVPAGVTAISVGLSLYGNGFLRLDDHSMTEIFPGYD